MAGKKISQLPSGSLLSLPLSGLTAVVYSGITHQHSLSNLRQVLVDSGSHYFTGSQHINGDLTITGSVKSLIVGTGSFHVDNPEILHVQNSGSFNIVHFEADNQYYAQVNIKNTNSGNNSSTDLVLTADNGTETNHYIDLGINSSTYTGGLVGMENDAYLLNVGKDLYIGTVGGSQHPANLKLFAQNSWEEPQIIISGSRQISFNTGSVSSGYTYEFSGSAKLQNELKVDGSVTASYFIGDGSRLENLLSTTDWESVDEITIKNTEQLTFSGDYVLDNVEMTIEGSDVQIEYSPNKYFKKIGKLFIGGNLLVKDSLITNNGLISVGGGVILIGESRIEGTGIMI